MIIDIVPQTPDRSDFILGNGENPVSSLIESGMRLHQIGAKAYCMPCNTAHAFAPRLEEVIPIPLISMIDSTVKAVAEVCPDSKKIALFATTGTIVSGVYHGAFARASMQVLPLSRNTQDKVMRSIRGVKAGRGKAFVSVMQSCVHDAEKLGADCIVAACTELPLLTRDIDTSVPIVDPTFALAGEVVSFALTTELAETGLVFERRQQI